MRFPSSSIEIGVISCESTSLSCWLARLQPFVCLPIGGIDKLVRVTMEILSCRDPSLGLNKRRNYIPIRMRSLDGSLAVFAAAG